MKKTFKRFLSLILCTAMLMCMFPLSGLAAAGADGSVTTSIVSTSENADGEDSAAVNPFASIISFFKDLAAFIRALKAFIAADLPGLPFSLKK